MSSKSPSRTSIYSQDEQSSAADESSPGESAESEESGQGPAEKEPTQSTEAEQPSRKTKKSDHKRPAKQSASPKMRGYLNKDYRDLLNLVIDEAAGSSHADSEDLYGSQVGASYWTSEEKEAFFHALATKGRDDLPGISKAVRTKNQLEIRSYLLPLESTCPEVQAASPTASDSSTDIPAAYEIGERCEHALNLTAEVLESHVFNRQLKREERKYGKLWLIDEDAAAQIESHQQQKSLTVVIGDEEEVIEISSNDSENSDSESGPENEVVEVQSEPDDEVSAKISKMENIASADLLNPEAFLQLSRSLFMNSTTDTGYNWTQLDPESEDPATPAILRSAFDNFSIIAINYTRWIVQAIMFQVMSRLRAKDGQNPAAVVTIEDVVTAIDFLNVKSDWRKFWAGVARRCRIEVYSDSKQYHDGRPGTKNGRLLTYDEVERELGFPPDVNLVGKVENKNEENDDAGDSFSSEESSEHSEGEDSDMEEDDGDDDASSVGSPERPAKRKRADSLSSDEDEGDEHLNNVDERASREEERRLMEMLRYSVSPSSGEESDAAQQHKAKKRRKRVKAEQDDWRTHMNYMEPWEQQRIWMELEETDDSRE